MSTENTAEEAAFADLARSEAELEAKLAMTRLERKLVEAKAGGGASRKLKLEVRAARQKFREIRDAGGPVEGMAAPAPISGSIKVKGA